MLFYILFLDNIKNRPFQGEYINVETLYNRHRSRPYNPNIAGAFFRAGYVETWGRGIQKICEACKQYGVSNPEYIIHSEDILVKIIALQSTAQTAQNAAQLLEVE